MMIAAGKGVFRVMWGEENCHPNMIPVDIFCNGLIVVAWKTGTSVRDTEIPIYNLTELEMEPKNYGEIVAFGRKMSRLYPLSVMLGYPTLNICSNFYVFIALTILLQWIPAILIDSLFLVFGYKGL